MKRIIRTRILPLQNLEPESKPILRSTYHPRHKVVNSHACACTHTQTSTCIPWPVSASVWFCHTQEDYVTLGTTGMIIPENKSWNQSTSDIWYTGTTCTYKDCASRSFLAPSISDSSSSELEQDDQISITLRSILT